MIVDCHTHINAANIGVGASEYFAAAEKVDVCIVLAEPGNSGRPCSAEALRKGEEVNSSLSEFVARHREKMVGFAFVDPTKDAVGVKNVTLLTKKLDLKGVVLYCSSCGFHPAHSRAMRFYESASELGLPVFFHNGGPLGTDAVLDYAQPYLLDEVARTFPALRIVVGTMGVPFVEQTLCLVAKHENVYADLTIEPDSVWQVYNAVVAAHEHGVMDKMLFGSGYPAGNVQRCMETLLGFNKLLADTNLPTVPRGTIQNIIERDALKLLGIEK
jgi:uncharacterized protein